MCAPSLFFFLLWQVHSDHVSWGTQKTLPTKLPHLSQTSTMPFVTPGRCQPQCHLHAVMGGFVGGTGDVLVQWVTEISYLPPPPPTHFLDKDSPSGGRPVISIWARERERMSQTSLHRSWDLGSHLLTQTFLTQDKEVNKWSPLNHISKIKQTAETLRKQWLYPMSICHHKNGSCRCEPFT